MLARNIVVEPFSRQMKKLNLDRENVYSKQQFLQSIPVLEKKMDIYKHSIADNSEISWFIEELNKMAKQSSILLISITPMGDENKGDFQKSTMKIETQCAYHELGDFVSRIESSSRFIKISGFHAEILRQQSADKNIKASVLVSFFCPAKEVSK